ncbi:MAG: aquaporin [Planctomycetes bacterium]|nr:aquaporin [Planctomycetota bacterium]
MTRHEFVAAVFDGVLLGAFMLAAGLFGALLEGAGAPGPAWIGDPFWRRAAMGAAMGATAVLLIRSPIGQRSGAHMNPATTFLFWRLGRVPSRLAALYTAAQFTAGALGILLAAAIVPAVGSPEVGFVATRPGPWGLAPAFAAEVAMTFVLASVVLRASQSRRWNRHTALFAGALVCLYITFEAPISGMSMNPARTFASAFAAGDFTAFWLYATAPLLGMLLAAEWFVRGSGRTVHCAKLHHDNHHRCPFRCRWDAA